MVDGGWIDIQVGWFGGEVSERKSDRAGLYIRNTGKITNTMLLKLIDS